MEPGGTALTHIAFWLIPSRPHGDFLRYLIRDLASKFDAPIFEPHVTLYGGPADSFPDPASALRVAAVSDALTLKINSIDHSDVFTKTLFIDLAPSESVFRLAEGIRAQGSGSGEYQIKPHVSLLYKTLEPAERRELASSVELAFAEITFDSIYAVRIPADNSSKNAVESWREACPPVMLSKIGEPV